MIWDPMLVVGLIFAIFMIVFYIALTLYVAVVFIYDRRRKNKRRKQMKIGA